MVGVYLFNDQVVPPLKLDSSWPGLTCLPSDEPELSVVDMLAKAFPEAQGGDLLRLEDHIRHNTVTLVCKCGKQEAPAVAERLQLPSGKHLRVERAKIGRSLNPDLLPPLNGRQYNVCMPCAHFSLEGNMARCSNRWHCKWGAARAREWDVTEKHVLYHSQCTLIERHFRFETAFLCWMEKFADEVAAEADSTFFFALREHLLRRDLRAAAEHGDLPRIRKRCADLKENFAEIAAREDVLKRMLSFWEVNSRLVENVRLLREEGIPITEEWRNALLKLSGETALVAELRHLLQ
jgi:hypothetical protein